MAGRPHRLYVHAVINRTIPADQRASFTDECQVVPAGHLGIDDIFCLDIIFYKNAAVLQEFGRDISLRLKHSRFHAPHSFMKQDIPAGLQMGAFHNSHYHDIALGRDTVSLQHIPVHHNASGKINISNGVVNISGHGKYIFHMKTPGPECQIALAGRQKLIPLR